jgi:hypothetical protein
MREGGGGGFMREGGGGGYNYEGGSMREEGGYEGIMREEL